MVFSWGRKNKEVPKNQATLDLDDLLGPTTESSTPRSEAGIVVAEDEHFDNSDKNPFEVELEDIDLHMGRRLRSLLEKPLLDTTDSETIPSDGPIFDIRASETKMELDNVLAKINRLQPGTPERNIQMVRKNRLELKLREMEEIGFIPATTECNKESLEESLLLYQNYQTVLENYGQTYEKERVMRTINLLQHLLKIVELNKKIATLNADEREKTERFDLIIERQKLSTDLQEMVAKTQATNNTPEMRQAA